MKPVNTTKSKPVLRPATRADISAMVEIENLIFDTDRISPRSFRTLLARPTATTLVVEVEGAIAGYAVLLFRQGTAMSRLYSIGVHPDHAGKGIGEMLIDAAEASTFKRGRMLLRLEVREDNERAIRLYHRKGFRPIGKYLHYYDDLGDALRFEKKVRPGVPLSTDTYYEQTTDFTCGPACLMMAFAKFIDGYKPDPVKEIRLWREATTIFMMSGLGGCDPYGMAIAAHEGGLDAEIFVSKGGDLFLDSVRTEEKRTVMTLAQKDFRARVKTHGIAVHRKTFQLKDVKSALARGDLAIVLVSGYAMFGKKVPHWVLAQGDDGAHILIHDPWVEEDTGETLADAANLPVPYEQFEHMSRFGKDNLRAAIILGKRK
jgi:ribosomal protein S18 acetylase RimI-like enzyme